MSERLTSLDAFRGATVAAMILVNNPGSWSAVYGPLEHAAWHGWTPTDLIFPFFLFIVGMALAFSKRTTFVAAARRAGILFALGVFMAAFPFFDFTTVRIPGVLQRIAVCYLAAWAIRRRLSVRGQVLATAGLLIAYWGIMTQVPVPGGAPPNLEPSTSLAAYTDRALLDGHLWKQTKTWDPEGPLSTLPAVATTLLGALAGAWLQSNRSRFSKALWFIASGVFLVALGVFWGRYFPINKNLWTSSYVLFTGGLAAIAFAACYWLADVKGYTRWSRPFVVFGVNAIFVFVASGLVGKTLALAKVGDPPVSLQARIYESLFATLLSPKNASVAYALTNVAFWSGVLLLMDRRGIRVKV